jgi:hypothetical protein
MTTFREAAKKNVLEHKDAADSLACCMDMVANEGKRAMIFGDRDTADLCGMLLLHFADIARRLELQVSPIASNDELFEAALRALPNDELKEDLN